MLADQPITSPDEYAQRVERFMQGVVDRRAWDGYRVLVKVTVVKDSTRASQHDHASLPMALISWAQPAHEAEANCGFGPR